ncbi:oligosaccharide flippase family protein [Geomonas subterranea]|uniref:Oligosaccharide flippase family protein n=1 Tax=Geomonas subterranea TaxID=2847989 RepID=A0ABX8LMJ2_9BACT|nr:oligosaccharide flippase family protein [Geomonas subterranea]QXE91539.1 oligosaccharide flippase family protein [Geomonas subterranea]QXM10372.1 oligosaccharide flippase family protein [Geomonas subterranea]
MSLLKKNLAANFAGSVWLTLMNLAFIPLYIKFLGVESYGLIGVFTTIQAISAMLDMGLGAATTREMARLGAVPGGAGGIRSFLRSVEVVYWVTAILIGLFLLVLSPLVAHHWIKATQVSPEVVQRAVQLMGVALAFQWPTALYTGGLNGMQRQVLLNGASIVMSTVRGIGAVAVLWLFSATVEAFFFWQILVNACYTLALALCLWNGLPAGDAPTCFSKKALSGIWKFAVDMAAISLVSTVLTQLDKVVLSKMLSLETFGYYTLAGVVASSLYRVIGPVFSAVYPKFVQMLQQGDLDGVTLLYHKSCQLLSLLLLPVSVVLMLFSREVMLLWTRNASTAEASFLIVSVLVAGTALNGLMNIPYALQLASGWTRLTLCTNTVAIVVLVPLVVIMTERFGAVGGASVWVILNGAYVLFSMHLMHRRLLPGEKWRWYREDVFYPLVASLSVAGAGRYFMPEHVSQVVMICYLAAVSMATLSAAALSVPQLAKDALLGPLRGRLKLTAEKNRSI